MQVDVFFFSEIEHEELHLHTKVASILSETDSVYDEEDCSGLDNVFDHIGTIATKFQDMGSSILSFIKLLLLSHAVITYKNFINNDEVDSIKNNSLESTMVMDFESQFNNVFKSIILFLAAQSVFDYNNNKHDVDSACILVQEISMQRNIYSKFKYYLHQNYHSHFSSKFFGSFHLFADCISKAELIPGSRDFIVHENFCIFPISICAPSYQALTLTYALLGKNFEMRSSRT